MREHVEMGMADRTDTWLKRGVSGVRKRDRGNVLPDTWERVAEERNEGYRFAVVVELEVDGTLREEGGLVGPDLVEDEFGTVFRYHARNERAIGDIVKFCGPRVGVRGVHPAWSEETDGCETWDQLGRDSAQRLLVLIETSFPMVAGMVRTLADEL